MQQLVTKEQENFNKQLLATKVLNKSFFKIQNKVLLVSCCFPRRRLNRIRNTKNKSALLLTDPLPRSTEVGVDARFARTHTYTNMCFHGDQCPNKH